MSIRETRPGEIVEFLQNNQIIIGCVLEKEKKHLKVINLNQRLLKISQSRVLPWVGPTILYSTREEVIKSLNQHEQRRRLLEDTIDAFELWKTMEGEINEVEIDFMASLIWTNPDRDQIAALGRKLFKSRIYFRFEPPFFKIYSKEEVELRLKEEEINKERKKIIEQGHNFFQALLQGKKTPQLSKEVESKLKQLLFEKIKETNNKAIEGLWREITSRFVPNPFLPLILAKRWGIIPRHYNYLLDQGNYSWGDEWSMKFSSYIEDIVNKTKKHTGEVKKLPLVSIDSETTKDIDDAIFVKREGGIYKVIIAIACPVLFWKFGSDLDHHVIHRSSSIYLPEGTSHMLPEILATNVYSLHSNTPKPSIVLTLILNSEGEVIEKEVSFEWIQISTNTTYVRAENDLEEKKDKSPFYAAYELANILRTKRLKNGAVIVEQSEPVIQLIKNNDNNDVEVELKEPKHYPKANLIVSELMVLANSFIGNWAKERNIPLIYRTQDMIVSEEIKGVWNDPVDIYRIMKEMAPSILEITPKPHISLGVNSYSPISSPLRRYSDFLNIAQIFSFLVNKTPLFSSSKLEEKLPYINSRLQVATKIQKFRTRYWKLLYFKKLHKQKLFSGIVVGEEGENLVFSLPKEQILLKAPKKMFNVKNFLGKRVYLKLSYIDPLTNSVKIGYVKGEENG